MKLWEKLSATIFRLLSLPFLHKFETGSPERILTRSLKLLDQDAIDSLKAFVKGKQTKSGGFADKAGNADLYYTLFGYYLVDALGLYDIRLPIEKYLENEVTNNKLEGVHLHCAAILADRIGANKSIRKALTEKVRENLKNQFEKQAVYNTFLSLLTCYYVKDFKSLYRLRKQSESLTGRKSFTSPVVAAFLVLQSSFRKPVKDLREKLLTFYNGKGGFKATVAAPVPDLLSTAVALYALNFTGYDLSIIKPDSLDFVDSMFTEGGFMGNVLDTDPDVEYTFYGLLALGSLAD
jgi:hypothetical protein